MTTDSIFSVTVPVEETSILSLAELREAADVTDNDQDLALLRLGRRASASLARACNIVTDGLHVATLLSETCEERVRRIPGCLYRLARRPVPEIVSVTVAGVAMDLAAFEVNAAAGTIAYAPSGTEQGWPAGPTVITYKAGFAVVPDDLKEAGMRVVGTFRADLGRDPNLKREDIPGVMSREYWVPPKDDPLLSQEVHDLIAPYVRRWL